MPQFDTFSFFSQLFWVFLFFFLFYSALSYYLLPAIAITLKIRRRKLSFSSKDQLSSSVLASNSDLISFINLSFDKLPKEVVLNDENKLNTTNSSNLSLADIVHLEKLVFKSFTTNFSVNLHCLTKRRK